MDEITPGLELFAFDNTYARDLEGLFVPWTPAQVPEPRLLRFNSELAEDLGLNGEALGSAQGTAIFGGNDVPAGAIPLAQAYAGHQFGGFSPQLGDGRALLLGEVIDRAGNRQDIALKGSGRTPFSRGGDGKAGVGPVLREYLIGEAMHRLGIPTTRALAAVRTGEVIAREVPQPGAVLVRVASSHVRVGTFEFFAARGDQEKVRRLADYVLSRHYPELAASPDRYLSLLAAVAERQAALLAQWMHVGFIHGVMNTDNMAVSGETIDYGPCAFMEAYDPAAVFSSIDHRGRYAFQNQPSIAQWNLTRFAETLLPLIGDGDTDRAQALATDVLEAFPGRYEAHWLTIARTKLGLAQSDADDASLVADWLALLQAQAVDFTLAWRRLADAAGDNPLPLRALLPDGAAAASWLERWRARLDGEGGAPDARAAAMRRVSPMYIPRNHRVEEALSVASDDEDLGPFVRLLDVITHPYEERPGLEDYATPAPAAVTAGYQTFCGT
jgi:serine/tyrosine/threonine adenylyltransferase